MVRAEARGGGRLLEVEQFFGLRVERGLELVGGSLKRGGSAVRKCPRPEVGRTRTPGRHELP